MAKVAKVAKLVWVSIRTRVIVDDNASDEQIMELAMPRLFDSLMTNGFENIESIEDDLECPFDPSFDEMLETKLN